MKLVSVKVWFCIACVVSSLGAPAQQQQAPLVLDIIDMAAISRMTPHQLEALAEGLAAEEIMRTKRSSAQALVSSVASKASSGIQSKVGLLGQASAFVASASSKSGHDEHPGYSYEVHNEKPDFLGLKKSILYTLFQAVKAITGGVTILKGQLIKGGGAVAATLAKVLSSKGDVVSNFGKKIVSSAALSKPKHHSSKPVYGPPPTHHVEYVPSSGYGAPTVSAHYSAPSAPTGYAAPVSKYPAHLDGRTKLHAGVVLLAPVGETAAPLETHAPHSGYTVEPSYNILSTVYGAFKSAFPSPAPVHESHVHEFEHPPPISAYEAPLKSYKPTSYAVNSYGHPATAEAYSSYNPYPPYAASKHSSPPKTVLTPDKIRKIKQNLHKVYKALHNDVTVARSSEELPKFNGLEVYNEMMKGNLPVLPTSVMSDSEVGVLPADLLPSNPETTTTTQSPLTTTSTTEKEQIREKKDLQYFLRGNKIVIQERQS